MSDKSHPFSLLPREAKLATNRCNYPAGVLGSLEFQQHPAALWLDGISEFHRGLFRALAVCANREERAACLVEYIDQVFGLASPDVLGYEPEKGPKRLRATCFRMIRGWAFDSNGREAAVLKGWVESRFGLLARYHDGRLDDPHGDARSSYELLRTIGTFGTAALDSQLDVLFTYCQYELAIEEAPGVEGGAESTPVDEPPARQRQREERPIRHLRLYRGITRESELEILWRIDEKRVVLLLNNLSSFTSERYRAEEFGALILEIRVPASKILFHNRLIPNLLSGEDEYMVLGGLYEAELHRF